MVNSIREWTGILEHRLEKAGSDCPDFEARQLIKGLCGCRDSDWLEGRNISDDEQQRLLQAVERREQGYPLQYLLGEWEFYGLPFSVGEGVLIPRPDTETLCETALTFLAGRKELAAVDLCSGSGCLAIAVDHYAPGNRVIAVEKSQDAVSYLLRNLERNHSGVQLITGDVLQQQTVSRVLELCPQGKLDLIFSNPPYLNEEEMASLQKEVSFEPEEALYAPEDGYQFYHEITALWKSALADGGMLCYEVGYRQAETVCEILKREGFSQVQTQRDLCGIQRVVSGIWKR